MKISQHLVDEMVAHAREDLPNECCGMVGGSDGVATKVVRVAQLGGQPAALRDGPAGPVRRAEGDRSGRRAAGDLPLAHEERRLSVADRREPGAELAGTDLRDRLAGRCRESRREGLPPGRPEDRRRRAGWSNEPGDETPRRALARLARRRRSPRRRGRRRRRRGRRQAGQGRLRPQPGRSRDAAGAADSSPASRASSNAPAASTRPSSSPPARATSGSTKNTRTRPVGSSRRR